MDYIPMTREAYDRKKAELDEMKNVRMPDIAEKIAAAREEGDLKENAEYHAQREAQGMLQAKINALGDQLGRAKIIDVADMPQDQVAFGATVRVKDLDYDDEEEITFVGVGDEDPDEGRYAITSPIGQGLLGKKVGETAEIEVPSGVLKFEVLEIEYKDL